MKLYRVISILLIVLLLLTSRTIAQDSVKIAQDSIKIVQDDRIAKTYCTQGIAYESIDELKLDLLNNAKKEVINELFGEFLVSFYSC